MSRKKKYPSITHHPTLNGELEVDWDKDYHQDFRCLRCNSNRLSLRREKGVHLINGRIACQECGKATMLSCKNKRFLYSPQLTYHKSLNREIIVDWRKEDRKKYNCLECGSDQNYLLKNKNFPEKRAFQCKKCRKLMPLSNRLSPHICRFIPGYSCPNSECNTLGPDKKTKGWIYRLGKGPESNLKCYFCNIKFSGNTVSPNSWLYSCNNKPAKTFDFNEDSWDLRIFGKQMPKPLTANFNFEPVWYKEIIKSFSLFLLNKGYSAGTVVVYLSTFRDFSRVILKHQLDHPSKITRKIIKHFIDLQTSSGKNSLKNNLSNLKILFEWLGIDATKFVRQRDYPKPRTNDPEWLDELVRNAVQHHLYKIPEPIARQYQIQLYAAARPIDACRMAFDCLYEENGQWYVQFDQHRINRVHRIPAGREIRQLIEAQQVWIRKTLGDEYQYLFCHFRPIRQLEYPHFTLMKAVAKPPISAANANPMVKIIRLLVENENIKDGNGKKPHFTGRITRPSKLQEIRAKHGLEAAQLYADHSSSRTTFQHYAPPTQEQIAKVDLPFQELLLNLDNRFLPWQSLPESLLKNPKAHELDVEIAPRLVVYGHCTQDSKVPCPENLFPKCYGCGSFRPSTQKLPLYERQYAGEKQRLDEAQMAGAELAAQEASSTIEAMDKWLPELRKIADGESR